MPPQKDNWTFLPENASPRARELLGESFYWNICDDNSPLGNDGGNDALVLYRRWRKNEPAENVPAFIVKTLQSFGVADTGWEILSASRLKALLKTDWCSVLIKDDFIIGLAFAQLIIEGEIHCLVRDRAQYALKRQATKSVIDFRGWVDPNERRERLKEMLNILTQLK